MASASDVDQPKPESAGSDPSAAVFKNDATPVNLQEAFDGIQIQELLDQLDRELIGLQPVKCRIREIAALLVVNRARKQVGLSTAAPSLHMS
ncbi:MAG: CbbX protein, partial [Cyanobacteriota bacterium]